MTINPPTSNSVNKLGYKKGLITLQFARSTCVKWKYSLMHKTMIEITKKASCQDFYLVMCLYPSYYK
jgi:hypothetical protein